MGGQKLLGGELLGVNTLLGGRLRVNNFWMSGAWGYKLLGLGVWGSAFFGCGGLGTKAVWGARVGRQQVQGAGGCAQKLWFGVAFGSKAFGCFVI